MSTRPFLALSMARNEAACGGTGMKGRGRKGARLFQGFGALKSLKVSGDSGQQLFIHNRLLQEFSDSSAWPVPFRKGG
jgi:hypothetical protein